MDVLVASSVLDRTRCGWPRSMQHQRWAMKTSWKLNGEKRPPLDRVDAQRGPGCHMFPPPLTSPSTPAPSVCFCCWIPSSVSLSSAIFQRHQCAGLSHFVRSCWVSKQEICFADGRCIKGEMGFDSAWVDWIYDDWRRTGDRLKMWCRACIGFGGNLYLWWCVPVWS